jgi:hypothetical protein
MGQAYVQKQHETVSTPWDRFEACPAVLGKRRPAERQNVAMPLFFQPPRSFRDVVRVLREFEGAPCLWRVPTAGLALLLIRGIPVFAAVVVALIVVGGRVLQALVSAIIALVFDGLGKRLRARFPWHSVVTNRLWIFEQPNPATEVPVLIRSGDVEPAQTALRRAKLNPAYGRRVSSPPADAPTLDYMIGVHEPSAWLQSASDADRIKRIAAVVREAGISARVGGIEVLVAAVGPDRLSGEQPSQPVSVQTS